MAGVAGMSQTRFLLFNVAGALIWVFSLVTAGFFLGGLPFVQKNFSLLIYLIILVSVAPVLVEVGKQFLRSRKSGKRAAE